MVRNVTGGNGSKGLARKDQVKGSSHIQLSTDPLELYACVTKTFGNGMVEIYTNDNIRLMGHIRNKFRGKNKRNNLITVNSVVLVGLRDYEKPPKNCDILTIYDDMQIEHMKQMPNIKIDHILKLKLGFSIGSGTAGADVDFIDNPNQAEDAAIARRVPEIPDFELSEQTQIDVDDI